MTKRRELGLEMLRSQLESAENRCRQRASDARRSLDDIEKALADPSYRVTLTTAEVVRSTAEAFSALSQVAALRLAIALMEDP